MMHFRQGVSGNTPVKPLHGALSRKSKVLSDGAKREGKTSQVKDNGKLTEKELLTRYRKA